MIMVKLMGGLGNQMFQYATARRVAKVNKAELKLDLSFFSGGGNSTVRSFSLDKFNITGDNASKKDIRRFKIYKKSNIRYFRFIYNRMVADSSIYITEKGFGFNPHVLELKDDVYMDGYWQSEKYFKDIEETIRREFTLKEIPPEMSQRIEEIASSDSVSIHIRRGDYVSNPELLKNYGLCSAEYYNKAVNEIGKKYPNPKFYVFSDDTDWVKNNLHFLNSPVFASDFSLSDFEEMILMTKCKSNIIANSSFSWWGAWLNENANKTVIAPKKWFLDKTTEPADIIPHSWLKL
ncbi:MAG: alpha-1,2-fucosyltransferase [bacterium]|nr:alpha-1,2-fucosyltransferase [bacterium]